MNEEKEWNESGGGMNERVYSNFPRRVNNEFAKVECAN